MWADVPGFEGIYQISKDGQVRSLTKAVSHGRYTRLTPVILSQCDGGDGYANAASDSAIAPDKVHALIEERDALKAKLAEAEDHGGQLALDLMELAALVPQLRDDLAKMTAERDAAIAERHIAQTGSNAYRLDGVNEKQRADKLTAELAEEKADNLHWKDRYGEAVRANGDWVWVEEDLRKELAEAKALLREMISNGRLIPSEHERAKAIVAAGGSVS